MSQVPLSSELLTSLRELSSLLEGDDVLTSTLDTVVDLAVSTLPGCDSAGVTLQGDGELRTAAASNDFTLEMDKIQYDYGQGPCVEALRSGEFRQIHALSEETRWPEYCRRAIEKGVGSNLSFPLRETGAAGCLNIYAKSERVFGERAIAIGEIYASQASVALRNAQTYSAARALATQLTEALRSRDLIGQAKGILMEREHASDDEAFAMLVTISQNANIKVREVAERLVQDR
ncbi:MAG: ANTAR domain-containing protein [Actinomycetota bacterium]